MKPLSDFLAEIGATGLAEDSRLEASPGELADKGEHGMVFLDGRLCDLTTSGLRWQPAQFQMALARAARLEGGIGTARHRITRWRGRV